MAFGLFLWVSLLLRSSAVLSALKGGHYRLPADTKNLFSVRSFGKTLSLDEGEKEASNNRPTHFVYSGNNKPYSIKPLNLQPYGQSLPNALGVHNVEATVNGGSRPWVSNPSDPLTFPLRNQIAVTQYKPAAVQPESNPLTYSTSRRLVSPSPSGVAGYGNQMAAHNPFQSTSVAVSTGSSVSNKPRPASSDVVAPLAFGSLNQRFNSGSSPSRGGASNKPNLPFGRAFQYHPQGTGHSKSYAAPTYSPTIKQPSGQRHRVNTKPLKNYASLNTIEELGRRNIGDGPSSWPQKMSVQYPSLNAKPSQSNAPNATEKYSHGSHFGYGSSSWYASPAQKPSFQSSQGLQPSYKDQMGFPSSSGVCKDCNIKNYQVSYQPQAKVTRTKKIRFPQRVYLPARPQPLHRNFFVQSESPYHRSRVLHPKFLRFLEPKPATL